MLGKVFILLYVIYELAFTWFRTVPVFLSDNFVCVNIFAKLRSCSMHSIYTLFVLWMDGWSCNGAVMFFYMVLYLPPDWRKFNSSFIPCVLISKALQYRGCDGNNKKKLAWSNEKNNSLGRKYLESALVTRSSTVNLRLGLTTFHHAWQIFHYHNVGYLLVKLMESKRKKL